MALAIVILTGSILNVVTDVLLARVCQSGILKLTSVHPLNGLQCRVMESENFENMRVLVTGGTGFVGKLLLRELKDVIVVGRKPPTPKEVPLPAKSQWVTWADPSHAPLLLDKNCGVRAVINLMGESIAEGRWTASKKRSIRDSRVLSTENLVRAMGELNPRPQVLVSASAMGFYGSRGDQILDEAASSGSDFLAEVCREWEAAAIAARDLGIRVVLLRIGLVLGRGGFLAKVAPIFRKGFGGRLGDGRQWTSFIHVDDLVALILQACRDPNFSGPINASTPFPVRNNELTRTLAECVGRAAYLPVPRMALRLAYGELADAMLASIRMHPAKAISLGFEFKFENIHDAISAALS